MDNILENLSGKIENLSGKIEEGKNIIEGGAEKLGSGMSFISNTTQKVEEHAAELITEAQTKVTDAERGVGELYGVIKGGSDASTSPTSSKREDEKPVSIMATRDISSGALHEKYDFSSDRNTTLKKENAVRFYKTIKDNANNKDLKLRAKQLVYFDGFFKPLSEIVVAVDVSKIVEDYDNNDGDFKAGVEVVKDFYYLNNDIKMSKTTAGLIAAMEGKGVGTFHGLQFSSPDLLCLCALDFAVLQDCNKFTYSEYSANVFDKGVYNNRNESDVASSTDGHAVLRVRLNLAADSRSLHTQVYEALLPWSGVLTTEE